MRFWAAALEAKSRELQIPLINLFEDFEKLPDEEIAKLSLDRAHFNVEGNQRVASLIYGKLMWGEDRAEGLAGQPPYG